MKTFAEVAEWCAGAAEQLGDPSLPVCQLFLRWQDQLVAINGNELVCGWIDGRLVPLLGPHFPPLPMEIMPGDYELDENGELKKYGAELVTKGVWALSPSLNAEGVIHAFIVLYDVPDPAPWEQRIVLL